MLFVDQYQTEGVDAPNLSLPDGQDRLVERVAEANPHTVVVLETGGPVLMPWLDRTAAVISAWYPGEKGGEAIADILTGVVDPSGRLPVTWPASEAPPTDTTPSDSSGPIVLYDASRPLDIARWPNAANARSFLRLWPLLHHLPARQSDDADRRRDGDRGARCDQRRQPARGRDPRGLRDRAGGQRGRAEARRLEPPRPRPGRDARVEIAVTPDARNFRRSGAALADHRWRVRDQRRFRRDAREVAAMIMLDARTCRPSAPPIFPSPPCPKEIPLASPTNGPS